MLRCHLAAMLVTVFISQVIAEDSPKIVVLPFENLSGVRQLVDVEVGAVSSVQATGADGAPQAAIEAKKVYKVDRLSDAPRSILEDVVVGLHGQVVERQRLDHVLLENEFTRASGLIDPTDALKAGKMSGATVALIGTINELRVQTKQFSGYGIATKQQVVTSDVRVRLIALQTGQVTFSTTVTGTLTESQSQFSSTGDSDRGYGVLKNALMQLAQDADFKRAVHPQAQVGDPVSAAPVEIEIAPVQEGCEAEIDGAYAGSTPLKIKLPEGRSVKVVITKAKFKTWERTVLPRTGLVVNPNLEQEP